MTFNETGLPSGTTWLVEFDGVSYNATTSSALFYGVPNGTYVFSVENVSGYDVSPSSGTIHVQGAAITQAISFSTIGGGFLGLSGVIGYYLLGGIGAAVVIGIAVAVISRGRQH
ncbi:MAG: hypothetical protein ACREEC_01315 [Thermoplasmata archaeon]